MQLKYLEIVTLHSHVLTTRSMNEIITEIETALLCSKGDNHKLSES